MKISLQPRPASLHGQALRHSSNFKGNASKPNIFKTKTRVPQKRGPTMHSPPKTPNNGRFSLIRHLNNDQDFPTVFFGKPLKNQQFCVHRPVAWGVVPVFFRFKRLRVFRHLPFGERQRGPWHVWMCKTIGFWWSWPLWLSHTWRRKRWGEWGDGKRAGKNRSFFFFSILLFCF